MKVSLFYLPSVGSKAEIEKGAWAWRAPLRPDAARHHRAGAARRRPRLRLDQFHRASFSRRRLRAVQQPGAARSCTSRCRPSGCASANSASCCRRRIRSASPRTSRCSITCRGGRANAGFARGYQRRWVDIMAQQTHGIHGALPHQHDEIDDGQSRGLRGMLPHHQAGVDPGLYFLRRQILARPARRNAVDARGDGEMGRWRRERHRARGRGRAQAGAETASADLPAVRVVGTEHPMVRAGRCHRDSAAASSVARTSTVRSLRGSLAASRSAKGWACCAIS